MCGRYELDINKDIEEISYIVNELELKYGKTFQTGEIYPTNVVPVFTYKNDGLACELMEWGLPKWDNRGVIINARSETVFEKKMFNNLIMENRCVVITTGFYEWQTINNAKRKDKFLFTNPPDKILYLGGFYNTIVKDGVERKCFTILTQEANESISDIHNRMPLILKKNEIKLWLKNNQLIHQLINRNTTILERMTI